MSVDRLATLDPIFAECLRIGGPALADFVRPPGFAGLLRIVLEQQLSTRVALALWEKLRLHLPAPTPAAFLALDDDTLRSCGFSRQKTGYARGIAEALATGALDLDAVHALDDEAAVTALSRLKGIGRWSAEIYLMAALERPDVWPVDDLAIALGVQRLKGWDQRPTRNALIAVAEPWRPHRTLAARLVWHHYVAVQELERRARRPGRRPRSS